MNAEVKFNPRWPSLHPYPRSWYAVAFSEELKVGEVINRKYFGQEVVIYRTESGKAMMIDAYCPHLGAHFGHGGSKIIGESIKCPFHGWEFGTDGACTLMPYGEKEPKRGKTTPWLIREINGMIMAWYDAEGGEPFFEIPENDYSDYIGPRTWETTFKSHPQEVYENGSDTIHFQYIHRVHALEIHDCEITGPHLQLTMSSNQNQLLESERFDAGEMPEIHFNSQNYGLGIGFTYSWTVGMEEKFWFCMYVTPIDEETVHVRQYNMREDCGDDEMNEVLISAFHEVAAEQISGDIPVWENKVFKENPSLNEMDRPFVNFRRWCKQFYYGEEAQKAQEHYSKMEGSVDGISKASAEANEAARKAAQEQGLSVEEKKQQQREMLEVASQSIKKIKEVQGGDAEGLEKAVAQAEDELGK